MDYFYINILSPEENINFVDYMHNPVKYFKKYVGN
jgi:hypothetical protein